MNPNWLKGKTIKMVKMYPFDDGRGGTAHAPVIWFTNGACITFTTQETDTGEYGTAISYHKKAKKP